MAGNACPENRFAADEKFGKVTGGFDTRTTTQLEATDISVPVLAPSYRRMAHLFSALFQVSSGPNSYCPLETTNRLLTGGMAPSARCLTLRMKTFRGSALMEGKAHVPETCKAYRRPVPTASKVRGRSKTPALELENLTTKWTDSPARIFKRQNFGTRRDEKRGEEHDVGV